MKTVTRMLCSGLIMACLTLICGCASIEVVESWHKPQVPAQKYKKVMIVGIGHDDNVRAMVENILVEEFGRSGVTAVASHTYIKEIDNAKREDIVAAVRTAGADAVLTLRPISKGNPRVTQGGQSDGIYGTATNFGGTALAGARTYADAVMLTTLYDGASAELVWSATISTFDANRPARVSRDLAKYYLENLTRDGFL